LVDCQSSVGLVKALNQAIILTLPQPHTP
jgi:hypothetical protein